VCSGPRPVHHVAHGPAALEDALSARPRHTNRARNDRQAEIFAGVIPIVAFLLWIGGTVAAFIIVNVVWPAANRRDHNEIIGWQLSVIGTTYAVILAFMLFNVWDNFRTADINADRPLLYVRGNMELLTRHQISIVGSRRPTP
jgi:hypothetical protein